jgi:AraC-like DNA-binding protein
MTKLVPSFNLYKNLDNTQGFAISLLEQSYTGYTATLPHRHEYYEMIFFEHSGGLHEIDFLTFPVEECSIHLVSPGQVHLLKRESHVKGFVLAFTEDFFLDPAVPESVAMHRSLFQTLNAEPCLKPALKNEFDECMDYVHRLKNEFESGNEGRLAALQSWLKLLLITCKRIHTRYAGKSAGSVHSSEITQRFKVLLEKEFRSLKRVAEYADALAISPGHLSETVQKDTGKTAGEWIHQRIILEAKRLLFHSQHNVKEIAAELNYDDPSYFSKYFRNHTGLTPEQYRNDIREKYL